MNKRRWQDMLREIHKEAHSSGYYSAKTVLTNALDELVEEMEYAGVIEKESSDDKTN